MAVADGEATAMLSEAALVAEDDATTEVANVVGTVLETGAEVTIAAFVLLAATAAAVVAAPEDPPV